jgi:hypothetical protein
MALLCRWVGGMLLAISTVALLVERADFALPGAALSLVWLIAGQLAASAAASRDRPRPPSDP